MYGLKNLVAKGVLHEQSYNVLKKHSQQYRRNMNFFAGHLHQMIKIYLDYYELFESNLTQVGAELQGGEDVNPRFYSDILGLFRGTNKELRNFIERVSANEKSILQMNNLFIADYNVLVEALQEKGKGYLASEQNVVETCKKYFSVYKAMMSKIEAYKTSFVDVKLIYNNEEKVRLYMDCSHNYKKLEELATLIQVKVDELNLSKNSLVDSYKVLEKQLCNFTISFASRYIEELRKFFQCLFDLERNRLQGFIDKLTLIEKNKLSTVFQTELNLKHQNLLTVEIKPKLCQILPSFVVYKQYLKEQGIFMFKKAVLTYLYQMGLKIQQRKRTDRKMLEYAQKYVKSLQKSLIQWIRQTLQSFQKMRKRIGQAFGTRWISFYKIIAAIFQNCIQNTGRFLLRALPRLQKIQQIINQEASLQAEFLKQLRSYTEKNFNKKIIKKYTCDKEVKNQELLPQQRATSKQQIVQISQYLTNLIQRYNDGCRRCNEQTRQNYFQFAADVKQSMGEYFTYFNEMKNIYYNQAEYAKSYKTFQQEMSDSVRRGMQFFRQIQLSALVKQAGKVTFDSEFNKIQGFKKIKKPKELQNDENPRNAMTMNYSASTANPQAVRGKTFDQQVSERKNEVSDNVTNIIGKDLFLGELNSRHADFLLKKIAIDSTEKYIKSYSCSLSDTIILAGRLFITSHRLCFFSKFNAKNIFFGETFINIPRADIKKIDRRSMSLFSDNGLAITTVNGQLIFRSFFSRDATYDLIRKTFEVSNQEIFFQEEELNEGDSVVEKQVEFQDDMKAESGKERQQKLAKQIKDFSYTNIGQEQFIFPGLTVVKFLKMFELDQQVVINRTNYSSFLYYYKDSCQHRQINIEPWDPNPLQYLNVINVKEDSPQVYMRKITSQIPLPPSNIPFMPKLAPTIEDQTMFLINKDKVVIESIVKNTGIPYCDSYQLRMKRVIETVQENKIRVSAFVYINFVQSVLVRSTIESKSISSTRDGTSRHFEQIRSHLKNLQRKLQKSSKKQTPEQKFKELQDQLDELTLQTKKYKQQSKALQQQCTSLKQQLKYRGMAVIILFTLVIFEFVILIS